MKGSLIESDARNVVNNAICIIGPGRTGSTLLGKLVHSLRNVAYAYEPPFLHALVPLIAELPEERFRSLLETYLYEDQFMGQVTGRCWNFNRNDESCIYHAKTEAEVEECIRRPWTKVFAVEEGKKARLAVKITDVVPFIPGLSRFYPGIRLLVTHRQVNGFINSVAQKKWFSDDVLKKRRDIYWQGYSYNGVLVPYWVPEEDFAGWSEWPEVERIGYYYAHMLERSRGLKNAIVVSYEEVTERPKQVVEHLAEELGLRFGSKTEQLIAEIHKARSMDVDWVAQLSSPLRKRAETLSDVHYFKARVERP